MTPPWLPPSPPQVWAVEDTAAQVTWGELPPGPVTATAAGRTVTIDHRGGPGAVELTGLPSGARVRIELRWPDGAIELEADTLATPPGRLLARIATISDLHLGARRWGALRQMNEAKVPYPVESDAPHPERCARAAITEAVRWGAELLIIKGDAVEHETEEDFDRLGRLVDEFPTLPMLLIPGNHEVDHEGRPPDTIGRRRLPYTRTVEWLDLPGLRVLVADTTVPRAGKGTLRRVGHGIVTGTAAASGPTFVAIHHQLQPGRIATHWPIGIAAPHSIDLLDRLDALDQPVVVSSGHTHRNRSRRHGGVLHTEVASTKDWPGVWAGYAVHEGGIVQVVRRVAAPDAMAWTEYSRGAVGGLWARWSPGTVEQRCLSVPWAATAGADHRDPPGRSAIAERP